MSQPQMQSQIASEPGVAGTVTVPVIDIGPFLAGDPAARIAIPQAVAKACEDIGFFTIVGHGVDPAMAEAVKTWSKKFFDLTTAEKQAVRNGDPARTYRGYRAMGEENLAATKGVVAPGDFKEFFQINACDFPHDDYHCGAAGAPHFMDNCWPPQLPQFRAVATDYYNTLCDLSRTLMRIAALALELPEDRFDAEMVHQISTLRIINYPEQTVAPLPGQLRAAAHTDFGALTILVGENVPGSLQVLARNGEWVDVVFAPNSFVINIGDMMARWTNDKWVSTLHRVVNPPGQSGPASRRMSLAFFSNPGYDTDISCLPSCVTADKPATYPPMTAGDYRFSKFKQAIVKPAA